MARQSNSAPAASPTDAPSGTKAAAEATAWRWVGKLVLGMSGVVLSGVLLLAIALAMATPNLPDTTSLTDYRPRQPLRVFAADGPLLAEFGEERRIYTPIGQIPKVMKDAVLAIEDANFYRHGGVDFKGVLRAALAQFSEAKSQGASTITMQLARNFYLSTEKTFTRKIYEILLAFKIEALMTKDQILEVYMNQIFLGHRAYGYLTVPQDKSKKYPAVLILPSSGVHSLQPPSFGNDDRVGMAINIAWVDVDLPPDQYDWRTWPAPYLVTGILAERRADGAVADGGGGQRVAGRGQLGGPLADGAGRWRRGVAGRD
jgi:hypothetical protein